MDGKNGLNLEDFNFDAEELNKDMEVEYSDVPDIFAMNFNAEPEGEQGNENDLLNQMDAPEPEDNFDKLSPAGRTLFIIRKYAESGDEHKALFKQAQVITSLYAKANKEGATKEDKQEFAVAALEFHNNFAAYLSDIKRKNPERFNTNANIANLCVAFNIHSNLCARAVEAVGGDVLGMYIDKTFAATIAAGSGTDGAFSKTRFEDGLAKTLYLAKLKAEYDRVHGTEEEKKAWRSEILSEMMSDRFDENLKAFKESEIYKRAVAKYQGFGALPDPDLTETELKAHIDETLSEIAEDKYHEVYHYIGYGVQNEQEKQAVLKAVSEIEDLRAMGERVGEKLADLPGMKAYGKDPFFDTMHLMKRTKVYGEQKNLAGELNYKKIKEAETEQRILDCQEKKEEEYIEKFNKKWAKLAIKNVNLLKAVKQYVDYEKEIEKTKEEYKNFVENNARTKENPGEIKEKSEQLEAKLNSQLVFRNKLMSEAIEKFGEKKVYATEKAYKESEKAYNEYLDDISKLDEGRKAAREKGKQIILENVRQSEEYAKDRPKWIQLTGKNYQKAIKENDPELLQKVKDDRKIYEDDYKQRNPELYTNVNVTGEGEAVYISRPSEDAKKAMESAYLAYKNQYPLGEKEQKEQDDKVKNSIDDYDEKEKLYTAKRPIVKSDRSTQTILQFKPVIEPDLGPIDYKSIPLGDVKLINEQIDALEEELQPVPAPNLGSLLAYEYNEDQVKNLFNHAIGPVEQYADVWFGTKEYTDIKEELRLVTDGINNGTMDAETAVHKCRKLLMAMDQYIDRKRDERDGKSREKTNSMLRRSAMENARLSVQAAMYTLEKKAGIQGQDHTIEDMINVLELAKKITKSDQSVINNMIEDLRNENTLDALEKAEKKMFNYIRQNIGKHRNPRTGYCFRMRENEPGGKPRVPDSGNGILFKAVLHAYEKCANAHLRYVKENHPEKLPFLRIMENNLPNPPEQSFGMNAYKQFGVNVRLNNYPSEYKLRLPASVAEYKAQFTTIYKTALNDSFENHLNAKLFKEDYDAQVPVSPDTKKTMVESALSAIYLDKIEKKMQENGNEEFDARSVEEGRIRFISAMKKSSGYFKLLNKCGIYFDLSGEVIDSLDRASDIYRERSVAIANPERFMDTLLAQMLTEEIAGNLDAAADQLSEGAEFRKGVTSQYLENAEYNLKLAREIGLGPVIEQQAHQLLLNQEFTKDNLTNSLKSVKEALAAKTLKTQEEPSKGIKL